MNETHDAASAAHETANHAASSGFLGDPTFWAFVGLVLFIALIVWRKVPQIIGKSLDDRAAKIASELENARQLREDAARRLADVEAREKAAAAEAEQIIASARREAEKLAEQAARALTDRIAQREKTAEERIARAEEEAVRDVRLAAIEAASRAATNIITDKMAAGGAPDAFASALEDVRKALSS